MTEANKPKSAGMRPRTRLLFWLTAWLIVLLPFLFWRSTWFGRPLSDEETARYLRDDQKPRHIQHALVQIGERVARGDRGAQRWYPELLRLAGHPVEEIRNTAAWVMGQDNSRPEFHEALRKMLDDPSPMVRGNAALSLVRFGDAAGRPQIVAMLQPVSVTAPAEGTVAALARAGTPANHGTLLARVESGGGATEVRAPISGRIQALKVAEGARVAAGAELLVMEPGTEQVWEALRALYLIGTEEDLPFVLPYKNPPAHLAARVAQQAADTERAIRQRGKK